MSTDEILNLITKERLFQDSKWGEQNHSIEIWLAILGEEIGEISQAFLEWEFNRGSISDVKTEAIQAAAVIVAMLESIDRNEK